MASAGGRRGGLRGRAHSRDHVVEELVPSSAWAEDSNGHYLLVDLPEFKRDEVKLLVDDSSHIRINGERLVSYNKYVYFEQTYKLPENSDVDKITGKFDGEILYVTVPKQAIEERMVPEAEYHDANEAAGDIVQEKPFEDQREKPFEEEAKEEEHNIHQEEECNIHHDHHQKRRKEKHRQNTYIDRIDRNSFRKWVMEKTPLDRAIEMMWNKKEILITAVLAFSIGFLISRKFESGGE